MSPDPNAPSSSSPPVHTSGPRLWAVIPAAGKGQRFGGDKPKQYYSLLAQTVLEHSLQRLLDIPAIEQVMVAVAADDYQWQSLPLFADPRVATVAGGAERSDSVLAALRRLRGVAAADDWVLVHDAARPCVPPEDIARLIADLQEHPVGGLLAAPMSDTVKRAAGTAVAEAVETVDRSQLWRALTPQMFRYGLLFKSLSEAAAVTDEASAVEQAGLRPLLVKGSASNIKITQREDLALAALILQAAQDGAAKNAQGDT